jgi:hypothetical protein
MEGLCISGEKAGIQHMVLLDIGTGIYIVVVAIISICVMYAIIRWWRWNRQ